MAHNDNVQKFKNYGRPIGTFAVVTDIFENIHSGVDDWTKDGNKTYKTRYGCCTDGKLS